MNRTSITVELFDLAGNVVDSHTVVTHHDVEVDDLDLGRYYSTAHQWAMDCIFEHDNAVRYTVHDSVTTTLVATRCVGIGRHDHHVEIPDDPSTEIPCPDCGSRLASV